MKKGLILKRVSMMVGMLAVCLLVVLISPSFSASAAGPVTSITLDQTSIHLYTTQRIQLHATVLPTDATNTGVIWSSADTSIATVNSNGTVTGVSFGQTTITATAADGSGVYATCECLVNPYYENLTYLSKNQDARRVHFQFHTGSDVSMVYMHIGSRVYYVNKPSVGTPYDQTVNGDHIKASIDSTNTWDVQISLTPTTVGTTETIYFEMFNGYYLARSFSTSGFVFWDVSVLNMKGVTLYNYFHYYADHSSGIHYELVDCINYQTISCNYDTTYLSTGMIILKEYGQDIVEVIFVIVYGDVSGGNGIGDGLITYGDNSAIYVHVVGLIPLDSPILMFAADVDHDGAITETDANLVMQEVAFDYTGYLVPQIGAPLIVPDVFYYLTPVAFS